MTTTSEETREPGSRLVEELRLLIDAVAERAGPWLDRVAASSHDEHADLVANGRRAWCPLCALTAVIRGEPVGGGPSAPAARRAEGGGYNALAARSLDRAADLVALLRAVLADRWEPGVPHMPGFTPTRHRPPPPPPPPPRDDAEPRPRVQRIPVRRKEKPMEAG